MKKIFVLFALIMLTCGCSLFEDNDLILRKLNGGEDYSFLKGKDIQVLNSGFYLDSNGNIYDIVKDKSKTFDNDQKTRISEYLPYQYSYSILTGDAFHIYIAQTKTYQCYNGTRFDDCTSDIESSVPDLSLQMSKSIKQILDINEENDEYTRLYYISTDGKIYLNTYKQSYENGNTSSTFISSKVYMDNQEYGNILYAQTANAKDNNGSSIKMILTDKGLYKWDVLNKEDAEKYEGLDFKYGFVLNKEYEKIKDKVIYNDLKLILTSDYKLFNFTDLITE